MSSPVDLDPPGFPSIAWNSFGHSELVDTPGTATQLAAVEPLKVGIGLPFGGLRVQKVVEAGTAITVPAGPYPISYSCTVTPEGGSPVVVRQGTATIVPGSPFLLPGVPSGARCQVVETDALGGETNTGPGTPAVVDVGIGTTTDVPTNTVTITNRFGPPPPPSAATTIPPPPSDPTLPASGTTVALLLALALTVLGCGLASRRVASRRDGVTGPR